MQDFSIFDLIIISITLILGLKGLFRGLIKEVFGIIGIIGAIFVASRIAKDAGDALAPILAIQSEATLKLIGFVVALVGFWLIVYTLGVIISKIFSASGLGVVDRIFGFIFGASKVFLIFSVIAYALYQVQSFKKVMDEKFEKSYVMPHLISVGSYIIKLDTTSITNTVDKVVNTTKTSELIDETKNNIKQSVEATTESVKEAVKEEVVDTIEKKIEETKTTTQEQVDTTKEKLKSIANKPEN
ncbi:MAG: CvpA family protein [Aliarcobacter sp.]|nr:CvpA family protein [Aliarcobacter sp.]